MPLGIGANRHVKRLIYVGFLDAHRGIEVLIKGVYLAARVIPSLSSIFVGSGGENHMMYLKKMVKGLSADNYVEFTGWIPFERVPIYIQYRIRHIVTQTLKG